MAFGLHIIVSDMTVENSPMLDVFVFCKLKVLVPRRIKYEGEHFGTDHLSFLPTKLPRILTFWIIQNFLLETSQKSPKLSLIFKMVSISI